MVRVPIILGSSVPMSESSGITGKLGGTRRTLELGSERNLHGSTSLPRTYQLPEIKGQAAKNRAPQGRGEAWCISFCSDLAHAEDLLEENGKCR